MAMKIEVGRLPTSDLYFVSYMTKMSSKYELHSVACTCDGIMLVLHKWSDYLDSLVCRAKSWP